MRELFEIFAVWFPDYRSAPSDGENGESGSDDDDDPEVGEPSSATLALVEGEDEGVPEHEEDT